jgi:hypothetical protein
MALMDAKTMTSQKFMPDHFPNAHTFGEYLLRSALKCLICSHLQQASVQQTLSNVVFLERIKRCPWPAGLVVTHIFVQESALIRLTQSRRRRRLWAGWMTGGRQIAGTAHASGLRLNEKARVLE